MTKRKILTTWLAYAVLSGCTIFVPPSVPDTSTGSTATQTLPRQASARAPDAAPSTVPDAGSLLGDELDKQRKPTPTPAIVHTPIPPPLLIEQAGQTGQVANLTLSEISGLAVSRTMPGVLFAMNDGGNSPELYAMSQTGADLGHWRINARNRDWEDMANAHIDGKDYLVLGDTGDNWQKRPEGTLYLIEEPSLDTPASTVLEPQRTVRYRYEDGSRNVEAFAVSEGTVYFITKEPIGPSGAQASRLYILPLPKQQKDEVLVARFVGKLPLPQAGLEARLAAAVVGVDLNHPTALDFDPTSDTAYLLTYRHVIRIKRRDDQSWDDALTASSQRIHAHTLRQAEALAVLPGQSIWFTSEHAAAPIWALPITPPS